MAPAKSKSATAASFEDVKFYGRTCHSLDIHESEHAARLCESGKQLLRQQAGALVNSAGMAPILMHYSADGTRLGARDRRSIEVGGKKTKRQGERSDEYLVQHMFYRFIDPFGKAQTVAVLRDPLPLTKGTTAEAIFSAAKEFLLYPRQMGHAGIIVVHYSFDRALYSAMRSKLRKYEQYLEDTAPTPAIEQGSAVHRQSAHLLQWSVSSGCALHDCHNALKWSMASHFMDPEHIKDLYCVVGSMMKAFTFVHDHLYEWMVQHVEFVADDELADQELLREMWLALKVNEDLVPALVRMRLRWSGGNLQVAASQRDVPGVFGDISAALLSLWKFTLFTESRWMSVGKSSRAVVCALFTGFHDLMAMIRRLPHVSDTGLSAFDKMGGRIKECYVLTAMVAHVPEGFLAALMEDSRLPLRIAELEAVLDEDMQYVANVKPEVWEMIGSVCDWPGARLRSSVMYAAHKAIAFIHDRALSAAKELPWSLIVGNMNENLDRLAAGPCPDEPVAAKIWRLLGRSFPRSHIIRGLELLQDCPWGTATVEQQHASGTVMRKYHAEMGQDMLCVRAFLHTVRCLLPGVTPVERRLAMLERQEIRLSRCTPSKITGRHLYLREMMDLAMGWKAEGRELPAHFQRIIMKRHAAKWQQLAPAKKARYEQQVAVAVSEADHDIDDKRAALEAKKVKLHEKQALPPKFGRPPLQLSACPLGQDAEVSWQSMFGSAGFKKAALAGERKAALEAPAVDETTLRAIADYQVYSHPRRTDYPAWLGPICRGRDFFDQAALVVDTADGTKIFLFMYAKQSPLQATFAEIVPTPAYFPLASIGDPDWESIMVAAGEQVFYCSDYKQVVGWEGMPPFVPEQVGVLRPVDYIGEGLLCSSATLVPLDMYLDWLPPVAARKPRESAFGRAGPDPAEAASSSATRRSKVLQRSLDRSKAAQAGVAIPAAVLPVVDEDEELTFAAGVAEAMEAARAEVGEEVIAELKSFKVRLLGGDFTMKAKAKGCDYWLAECRGKKPKEFVGVYFRYASFRVGIELGADAHLLCRMWCHRMQYFFDVWLNSGDAFFVFQQSDIDAYREPPELQQLIDRLAGKHKQRALDLRKVVPI